MKNGFSNPNNSFGKRLEFLMEEDGIVIGRGASGELSRRLYEKGILKYNSVDYDTQNKERDNIRSRIDSHRKTDSAENVSGNWLKTYCDYFHCSADYLFGYIELPTHEKTNIKNHTGLSKDAIDKLINLYNIANSNEDIMPEKYLNTMKTIFRLQKRIVIYRQCKHITKAFAYSARA